MTKFERWLKAYGVTPLARELTRLGPATMTTPSAIYQWVYGKTEPRLPKVRAMVRLSRGAITVDDVFRHVDLARAKRVEREQQAVSAATTTMEQKCQTTT